MKGNLGALLSVLVATLGWATSGFWIKQIVARGAVSALDLAFWRDTFTFLILLIVLTGVYPQWWRVRRRDWLPLAGMGVFGIGLFHVLWNLSVVTNGMAMATFLAYLATILVPLGAWLFWRETGTLRLLMAAGLAVLGIGLMVGWNGNSSGLGGRGILIGILSACGYASFSLFGKGVSGRYHPWVVLTYAFGFAALVLCLWQIARGGAAPLPPATWPPFAALILIATIGAFGLYTMGLRRLRAGVAAIAATSELLFTPIIAYTLAGERLERGQIPGALLIAVAVLLAAMPAKQDGGSGRVRDTGPSG
jgi:drug/metabolite transporter (DMT)-like permease